MRIELASFAQVEQEWESADRRRGDGNTIGLLLRLQGEPFTWWRVQADWIDLSRVIALPSNKREGQVNQWERLSGGSYQFEDIAKRVLSGAEAPKIISYAEQPVTWTTRPVCVTDSIDAAGATVICIDGCNRLAAAHVRRRRGEEQALPELIVGEGPGASPTRLNELYGFELTST